MRSSENGNGRSTSSGASPSTFTLHPVGRRSHAGSRSVVQYQLARNRSRARPSRMPSTVTRCAATVPASMVPAAMRGVDSGHRDLAPRLEPVERQRRARRPRARATGRSWSGRGSAGLARSPRARRPKPMRSKSSSGEGRSRQVGVLLDGEAVERSLDRRQHDRHRLGDEARAAAGAVDRGAALRAGRLDRVPQVGVHARRAVELAAGRHDVGAGRQQAGTTSSASSALGM